MGEISSKIYPSYPPYHIYRITIIFLVDVK
jgi:hypothetical protein